MHQLAFSQGDTDLSHITDKSETIYTSGQQKNEKETEAEEEKRTATLVFFPKLPPTFFFFFLILTLYETRFLGGT